MRFDPLEFGSGFKRKADATVVPGGQKTGAMAVMATLTDKLRDLESAKDQGLITEEEFSTRKASILASSTSAAGGTPAVVAQPVKNVVPQMSHAVVVEPGANAQLMEGGNLNPNITSAEDAAGCYLGICCPACCFPIFSSNRAAGPDALHECSWLFPTPLAFGQHWVRESPDSRWFREKGDNSVRKEVFANCQKETGPFHRYCAMKIC